MTMSRIKKYLKNVSDLFIEEFSSVKLAITLFILLAITTLIGTIIPEEPMVGRAELIRKYGLQNYQLLRSIGFTDVFHSWWYLALLTSLGINLIVASVKRVFPKCGRAFTWPVELKEEGIKKLPVNCEFPSNGFSDISVIEHKLRKKKYRTKIQNGMLLAMKGGWHRLGASVTHVGILTLLIGSAISTLTGYNGMAQVSEKEGFYLADLGQTTTQIRSAEPENWIAPISKMPIWLGKVPSYLIKVNKTWRENYEGGQPKQWYSDLSVYDENKKEVARKTIFVNNPLEFMGLDIYQSNWGRFLQIAFNNESASFPVENFRGEDVVLLPLSDDVGLKLKPVVGNTGKTIQDPSSDILEIYSFSSDKEKYLSSVKKDEKLQLGPINISYFGTQTLTGLQFKSNPGGYLIYPGLFIIICGVFIAFGSKRQIWAQVNKVNNKIVIGGNSDRAKGKFFEEFELIVSELLRVKY